MLRFITQFFLVMFLLLFLVTPLMAESGQGFDTFTLYYENDFILGTDRDYTSGLKLTWSTPFTRDVTAAKWPSWAYPLINQLPLVNDPDQQRAISLSFGQDIYTPEDIESKELIVDDRPYAGWTYFSVGVHGKNERRQHTWELNVGILGPASLAEKAQNLVHDLNGARDPQGWDHQLENEITFDAIFETQWKLRPHGSSQKFSYDFIPRLGGRVGTVNVYANAGGEFRFGWELPDNFGACPIRAGCVVNSTFESEAGVAAKKIGILFFVAADGRMVLRDIFLDGNTFRESHSVDKELFVADLSTGVSVRYGMIVTTYSYVYRTRQFEDQDNDQAFSSFSISWSF